MAQSKKIRPQTFMKLCKRGSAREIIDAVKNGADPNAVYGGRPMLTYASEFNDLEAVRALLEAGAYVNASTLLLLNNADDYFTALMYASKRGRIDIIKELLKAGADVNARDNFGRGAIYRAKMNFLLI